MEEIKSKDLTTVHQNGTSTNKRLNILKTYKLYVDGKFPRTESGRYYIHKDKNGNALANICQSSRKDFRDAVVAARKAQSGWASKTAYNKGQILYRMAEILEGRKSQFIDEMMQSNYGKAEASKEVDAAIDTLVYYAGWSDKYQQIFSSVNPVESSHFNFSMPEPMGVISVLSDENSALLGLVNGIAPAIVGGNVVIILASTTHPLCAVTLGEVLQTSDLPAGVVNILTGYRKELLSHFSNHMDVNACVYYGNDVDEIKAVKTNAAFNVKRAVIHKEKNLFNEKFSSPYLIMNLQEIKTTWHPVGV